jgi:undecaprenyl-diphosphatase
VDAASRRSTVAALDARVDRAFDRVRGNPAADRFFRAASHLGDFSLIWLLIGAARGLRSDRDRQAAVRFGVALAVESVCVNIVVKSFFRRVRPPRDHPLALSVRRPRTSSFPSGHATSAFTAAGILSDDDRLWPFYYGVAVAVAASRVHMKVHHASDVLAGAALGIVFGRIGRKLVSPPPESPSRGRVGAL